MGEPQVTYMTEVCTYRDMSSGAGVGEGRVEGYRSNISMEGSAIIISAVYQHPQFFSFKAYDRIVLLCPLEVSHGHLMYFVQ